MSLINIRIPYQGEDYKGEYDLYFDTDHIPTKDEVSTYLEELEKLSDGYTYVFAHCRNAVKNTLSWPVKLIENQYYYKTIVPNSRSFIQFFIVDVKKI